MEINDPERVELALGQWYRKSFQRDSYAIVVPPLKMKLLAATNKNKEE
jgi:hypothetical protein